MIETSAIPISSLSPLNWNSVGQVSKSKTSIVQKPLSLSTKLPRLPSNRPSIERRIYSYIKWETDAAHCDLNRHLIRSGSQPSPYEFLDAVKLLAHKTPNLRILELGSGQNDIMRLCLEALQSDDHERMYSTYTLATTSLDTAFMAKIRSKRAWNVDVVFLNIDQQPQDQSLGNGPYDVIIITDVRPPNHGFHLLTTNAAFFRSKS